MQLTDKHREYWGKNLKITGLLLALWFFVTFVLGFFARPCQSPGQGGVDWYQDLSVVVNRRVFDWQG